MDTEAIDLDVAEWFVNQFLDQELATRRADHGASDGDEAHAAWLALRGWFREVRQSLVPVPDPGRRTAEWLRRSAPELARQRRRVPFLLNRVATEDRELVDAWVSNYAEPQDYVPRGQKTHAAF